MTKRIFNVIYGLFLLGGFVLIFVLWMDYANVGISYDYKVVCGNQKIFDPTSKPITKWQVNRYGFFRFYDNEIRAECKNGTAWVTWDVVAETFDLIVTKKENLFPIYIKPLLLVFLTYNVILEIARRTFLYVGYGKPFIATYNTKIKWKTTN